MNKSYKFSPEIRERAVRMVQEHRGNYPSMWVAVEPICLPQIAPPGSRKQASIQLNPCIVMRSRP